MTIVIPRSTWGPRYANGFRVIGTGEWLAAGKEIWLHHSVTNPPGPNATLAEDCAHMRVFESIGQTSFGGGISYTWVIMPSGRVFQGHDVDRQGAHTYQRNNRSRAICFAGNYDVNALPARMENAAAALLRELGATIDGPHSAVYPTACPGRYAAPRIPFINALASGAPGGGGGAGPDSGDEDSNVIYVQRCEPTAGIGEESLPVPPVGASESVQADGGAWVTLFVPRSDAKVWALYAVMSPTDARLLVGPGRLPSSEEGEIVKPAALGRDAHAIYRLPKGCIGVTLLYTSEKNAVMLMVETTKHVEVS